MSQWEERFKRLLDEGNRLYQEGRDEESWAKYSEVIDQSSKAKDEADLFQVLRALINRGILSWHSNREEAARKDWLRVVAMDIPRGEWMDRIKIRALRNLAFMENKPPYENI